MGTWKKVSEEQPPQKKVLKTKIVDENGERNEQELIKSGNLWWLPDMSMYNNYLSLLHKKNAVFLRLCFQTLKQLRVLNPYQEYRNTLDRLRGLYFR